jgi:hypothetical protein
LNFAITLSKNDWLTGTNSMNSAMTDAGAE